jgi:general nucleoside transport system ATP-binding protein
MGEHRPENGDVVLRGENITKEFPGVRANDEVSIVLKRGEILSLLGENGAGKSTLVNILYGLYTPTSGRVTIKGKEVRFDSPREAIQAGLGMVHQHFMLVETLTVTENIILGSEPGRFNTIDYAAARRQVQEISERYHLKVDPNARIETLSVGQQQRVEILKALYREAEILILDEPTAVLTPQEVEELFQVVGRLRESGVSIILITHKLEEVKAVSERVYVLRQGKVAGERQVAEVSTEELANLMVGREVVLSVEKEPKEIGEEPIFVVESVTILGEKGLPAIDELSLHVRPGELVGIAGVDGNGQGELAEGIMGLRIPTSGRILYQDRDITRLSTKERIHRRISFVPADRQRFGLIRSMTVAENIIIGYHDREPASSFLRLNQSYIADYAGKLVEEYDIRTPSVTTPVAHLSGGNQQKLILAREFAREPRFALLNQPTRGVDVGAIEYIREQILRMRDQNVAVLLISLELEEIFALADRILVLYEGKIVAEFRPEETSREEVGYYMTGGTERSSA